MCVSLACIGPPTAACLGFSTLRTTVYSPKGNKNQISFLRNFITGTGKTNVPMYTYFFKCTVSGNTTHSSQQKLGVSKYLMPTPASHSLVWSSCRKASWKTTLGLHLFGVICGSNSKRTVHHLVHYHTAVASGSEEAWCLISWKYFLSLQRGLLFRNTNIFSQVKLFGNRGQKCLQLITAVIKSGFLLHVLMYWCFFLLFSRWS